MMAEVEKKGGICTVREVWSSHLFFLWDMEFITALHYGLRRELNFGIGH